MTPKELKQRGHSVKRKVKVLTTPSALAGMPMDKIRSPHISQWYDGLTTLKVGKRQQGLAREVLSSLFGLAVDLELIERSPIEKNRILNGSRRKRQEG